MGKLKPIHAVADQAGISFEHIDPRGKYMAKIPHDTFGDKKQDESKLIIVTAMNPSPPGEGKTTTSIGLTQGMAKIGLNPVLTLREPSMGPVFGRKGGGTGGGKARIMPDTEINLHFTGDAHAVASTHNLLSSITDMAAHYGLVDGFDPSRVTWWRVTSTLERSLRNIATGLGGRANGPMRENGFHIDAASEIMAILALATDYEDLRNRFRRIVVGYASDGRPVTAEDVNAVGPMMALMRDALKPNLVQTLEGQPALVHAGPFGNIAHGCNSIVADNLALSYGDFVITEAGFGADLGFEKFMDIKARVSGVEPAAAVVVCTVRAVKWHGGEDDPVARNMSALETGVENLKHAVDVVRQFGLPAVVAINRFPDDRTEEIEFIKNAASDAGAYTAVESHGFAMGGDGTKELASAVYSAAYCGTSVQRPYNLEDSIFDKVEALARNVYLAGSVDWSPAAVKQVKNLEELGWGNLPVCMAKPHLSLSADGKTRGKPTGHVFPIKSVQVSAGAGFVYAMAGDVMTMPGLPKDANAFSIDLDENGDITGVL